MLINIKYRKFLFVRNLLSFFVLFSTKIFAQNISGVVLEKNNLGKASPLIGATLRWQNAKGGVSTDLEGKFMITKMPQNHQLIVSSLGYTSDTLMVHSNDFLTIYLKPATALLQEVRVSSGSTVIDRSNPIHTEIITSKALAKAACCNLSESFETNASVSVSFADAVTGAKQIQLLGLNGSYVQTNTENIPNLRGLNTTFGINFIPGTWIASIDVGKGAGSVVSGYESMTGQINVELQKPELAEKFSLNTYANSFGRGEINLNLAKKISKKWSVGLLSHASSLQNRIDNNKDGFMDLPLFTQYNLMNRWKFQNDKYMVQFGIKALYEDRLSGQNDFTIDKKGSQVYGFGSKTQRIEYFSKTARLFQNKPYKGLGLIINGVYHNNQSFFGFKNYSGIQKTLYANLIYQNIFGTTNHQYKTGLSYLLDDYAETFSGINPQLRQESVPGAFFEYSYLPNDKFILVLGSRVDFHNLYGTRFVPRLHAKYALTQSLQLRASAGKGWRVANPLAENYGQLVSSRSVVIANNLAPEESWNYGLSLSKEFLLGGQKATLTLDGFATNFQNQLVVDMESPDLLRFYNLNGRSYANSFQAELNYLPAKRLEVKLAYRWFDVRSDYTDESGKNTMMDKQFLNKHRALFNVGYALPYDKWKFDFTYQWNGQRRVPEGHIHNGVVYSTTTPAFANINAQVTKTFKKWELYVGGENLGNFTQTNPIIAADAPFSRNFDAGMTWGPVIGRMIYVGTRYKIK